jgi:hypothetical protein
VYCLGWKSSIAFSNPTQNNRFLAAASGAIVTQVCL